MDLSKYIFLFIVGNFVVLVSANRRFSEDFWNSHYPGELLNTLDRITSNNLEKRQLTKYQPTIAGNMPIPLYGRLYDYTPTFGAKQPATLQSSWNVNPRLATTSAPRIYSTLPIAATRQVSSTPSPVQRKIDRTDNDSHEGGKDYDRVYDEFVHRYFDKSADEHFSDLDEVDPNDTVDDEDATSEDLSVSSEVDVREVEVQPFSSKSSRQSSKKIKPECRKVRRNRETCTICKNPRNGERSETCSYESSSEPQSYAYEKEQKYHKQRNDESPEADDDDVSGSDTDTDDAIDSSSSELIIDKNPRERTVEKDNSKSTPKQSPSQYNATTSSTCTKRILSPNKVCYQCRSSYGVVTVSCFRPPQDTRYVKKPFKYQNQSHQKRRIFKRTTSLFFNDTDIGSTEEPKTHT